MKTLKNKTIKFLTKQQNPDGNIENINNLEDFFQTINSYSQSNLLIQAKKSLNYICRYQTKEGNFLVDNEEITPIFFLESIVIYLNQLHNQDYNNSNNNNNNNNNKQDNCNETLKIYIKHIRRIIKYFEIFFDDIYLLIYRIESNKITFFAKENAILLSILEDLSQILNEYEYNKEADYFFLLKGKLDLGFSRYFWNNKNLILLKQFNKNDEFIISNSKENIEILQYYNIDNKYFVKKITESINKLKELEKFDEILTILIQLKKTNETQYKTGIKQYKKYLLHLPTKILTKKQFTLLNDINKSLNSDFKIKYIELKKEQRLLIETNSIKIANLVLKL